MRFTLQTLLLALSLSTTAFSAAMPDPSDPGNKMSRAAMDLFPRAINCPCTSTRTCGCGAGSWCHCEEENNVHSKAYCSKNKVCGCPSGSSGYCVPNQ